MKTTLLLFALIPLTLPAQNTQVLATISHQPLETWKAALGGVLTHVGAYSVSTCNYTSTPIIQSMGIVAQQIEVQEGMNLIAGALINPTALRAESKSKLSIFLTALKWTGIAASFALSIKGGNPDIVVGTTAFSSGVAVVETTLLPNQNIAHQQAAGMLSQVLNTADMVGIPGGGCVSRVFFAEYPPPHKMVPISIR